jgi:putative transposase
MRGRQICEKGTEIERLDEGTYRVASQSNHGFYSVLYSPSGWICSCPDHKNRSVECKHIWACKFSADLRKVVESQQTEIVIEPVNVSSCRFCGSQNIVRDGVRHNKAGNIQVYSCRDCNRYFSFNLGFEKMKASPQAITGAMQLYFSGESLRNVQKFLILQGVKISHVAIYKWISKYVRLMEDYLLLMRPKLGDTWRADELYLKVKGNTKYLYALMDDQTRFWIAQQVAGTKGTADVRTLFRQGRIVAGRNPKTIITDEARISKTLVLSIGPRRRKPERFTSVASDSTRFRRTTRWND